MKKLFLPLLALVLCGLLLTGCNTNGGAGKASIGDSAATINGNAVAKWEFDFYYQQGIEYLKQFGIDPEAEEARDILISIEEDAWNTVISNEVTRQLALEKGVEFGREEAEEDLATVVIPQSFGDEESFSNWLENYNITRDHALDLVITQKLSFGLFEELGKEINIGEAEARAIYNANPQEWDKRLVSHILIMANRETATEEELAEAQKEAEDLIARLNEGEDFAQLAKEFSGDTGSAAAGGKINLAFTANNTNFVEEFIVGSFALENVGDFSQTPVQSSFGFHIIKVDEINAGFDNLKDEIIEKMLGDAKNEAYGLLVQNGMDNAEVVRYLNFKYWGEGNEKYPAAKGLGAPDTAKPENEEDGGDEAGNEADNENNEG